VVETVDGRLVDRLVLTVDPAEPRFRALLIGEQAYAQTVEKPRDGSIKSVTGVSSLLGTTAFGKNGYQVTTVMDMSRDGVLYVFHPGMEPVFLRSQTLIRDMDSAEVDRMFLRNQDSTPTQYRVPRMEEVLNLLRGRCYINIDKFWDWPKEIGELIRRLGMQDQVLVKTAADPACFKAVEEVAADLPYMIITRDTDPYSETLLKRPLRYAGAEVLFAQDTAPVAQPDYIQWMHDHGLIVWANAIVYNHKTQLTGGHSDDIAVNNQMDEGWGWLLDRKFNIIQTDWPGMLKAYMNKR